MPGNTAHYIFYDLETTRREFFGEILTAYFVLTDANFQPLNGFDLKLSIRVSALEIPDPEAIQVNQIRLLEHQASAIPEYEAARLVSAFIERCFEKIEGGLLFLTGFNSSEFDLPFLRTFLIRNGINPYFSGNLKTADVMLFARYLAYGDPDFPHTVVSGKYGEYSSFSLENLLRAFDLLEGEQTHDAKEDVLLTLKLARKLAGKYSVSMSEIFSLPLPQMNFSIYDGFNVEEGNAVPRKKHYSLINLQRSSLLAADLERFKERPDASAVKYFNLGKQCPRYVEESMPEDLADLLPEVKEKFSGVTVSNFFTTTICDIEQDIYRLPIEMIATLGQRIRGETTVSPANQDFRALFRRYRLRNDNPSALEEKERIHFNTALREYFRQRYGHGLILNKSAPPVYSEKLSALLKKLESEKKENEDEVTRQYKEFVQNSQAYAWHSEETK